MSAQRTSAPRNPAYVDVAPFRSRVNRWLEIEMTEFTNAPDGKMYPTARLAAIVWPGMDPHIASRRLYALQHEQTHIHFDTADRIVCSLLGSAQLWHSEPDLAELYQSVNLISIDAQAPTCAAAVAIIEEMVREDFAQTGSRHRTAKRLGISWDRVSAIISGAQHAVAA